jgi:hypothetical protein
MEDRLKNINKHYMILIKLKVRMVSQIGFAKTIPINSFLFLVTLTLLDGVCLIHGRCIQIDVRRRPRDKRRMRSLFIILVGGGDLDQGMKSVQLGVAWRCT